jgi:ferredoxin
MRKNATCASNCVGCGKCEKHCPQGIPIRAKLSEAKQVLETPAFKIAFKAIKKFTHYYPTRPTSKTIPGGCQTESFGVLIFSFLKSALWA